MLKIFKKRLKKEVTNYDKWLDELNIDIKLDNSLEWQAVQDAVTLRKVFGTDPDTIKFMTIKQKAVYNSLIALEA